MWSSRILPSIFLLCIISFLSSSINGSEKYPAFRPPAVPLITFEPMHQKFVFHEDPTAVNVTYWTGSPMNIHILLDFNGNRYQLVGAIPSVQSATQIALRVGATITTYNFTLPGISPSVIVTLKFVTPKLFNGDDFEIAARPSTYIRAVISGTSNGDSAKLFVASSSLNAVSLLNLNAQLVTWESSTSSDAKSVKLGTVAQPVLGSCGDAFMLNWGYNYLSADRWASPNAQLAGGDSELIATFLRNGNLPSPSSNRTMKPPAPSTVGVSSHFGVGIAVVIDLAAPPSFSSSTHLRRRKVSNFFNHPAATKNKKSTSKFHSLFLNQHRREEEEWASSSGENSNTSSILQGHVTFSYNEERIIKYFGEDILPYWNRFEAQGPQQFEFAVVDRSMRDAHVLFSYCEKFDTQLYDDLYNKFENGKYATISSLAYRQTLAAITFGHSKSFHEDFAFLKEISSDGMLSTMDVIFPASPLLYYIQNTTGAKIIKLLLLPILHYANNETSIKFSDPFSPHQLGIYPIANAKTSDQEEMLLENTGNFLFMLQMHNRLLPANDLDYFWFPFYNLLGTWVNFAVATQLPDPGFQRSTDDFLGMFSSNLNLAAKGNIALRAFGDLCTIVSQDPKTDCAIFKTQSIEFAQYWMAHGYYNNATSGVLPHSYLAFHVEKSPCKNPETSWSTKYNILWQRLLGYQGEPYENLDYIGENEVDFYIANLNTFGYDLVCFQPCQKLDWMTWGAALSKNKTKFNFLFDRIFNMANQTQDRVPLTDLFDTTTGNLYLLFVSRPVVGAVFAPMLLHDWN